MKNTQLFSELSKFVEKIMYERASKGQSVSIRAIYAAARQDSTISDVDMNTVGEMYKNIAPQLRAQVGSGVVDSDHQVDKATGKAIQSAISKIISNRKNKQWQEVGQLMPSASVLNDMLKLFTSDFIEDKDSINKTVMREMQDAIRKAAVALLKRENKSTENKSFEDVINEALRLDALSVRDLNGRLNSMEDLFNQVNDEVNEVLKKMEKSKIGMSLAKKDEIDMRIEQLRNYTENIKQGAYTLALSASEQQKVLRGIFKEKYGKEITVNGVKKTVLDWNKLFAQSSDFRQDVSDVLSPKGYTPEQIDKVAGALKAQYDTLKASAQWNNVANRAQNKMLNDDAFLTMAAGEVAMSKGYIKYSPAAGKKIPDWEKFTEDTGQTPAELKEEIKNVMQNTPLQSADNYLMAMKDKTGKSYKTQNAAGDDVPDWKRYAKDKGISEADAFQQITEKASSSASQYRQIISKLRSINNPAKHLTKSDLVKLSDLAELNGFNDLFNARAYRMLGLSDKDAEAGRQIEQLSLQVKEVLDIGGEMSKLTMGKLLDSMDYVMSIAQGSKSGLLRFARHFEWWMGNRNSYRISNYINLVENSLSGVAQILQTAAQAADKTVAMKELGKMATVMRDVATGGKHAGMTDTERLSYNAHEYRFDPLKSLAHNMKAIAAFVPNLALGVLDSAAHSYTMRIMFYNSAVKVRASRIFEEKVQALILSEAVTKKEAESRVNKQADEIQKTAINDVTNTLYNEASENDAYTRAEQTLKIVTPNPTTVEIRREAANLMFQELVTKGIIQQDQLLPLLNAADKSAKKAIGKESSELLKKINPLSTGLTNAQMNWRAKIKKQVQNGESISAGMNIIANSVVMKGVFPFINGASNWGVIAAKKAGLGFLKQFTVLNKKDFRENIRRASEISPKELEELMERYNSSRNDVYLGFQGMIWTSAIVGALAVMRSTAGEDDEPLFEWIDEYVRDLAADKRTRKQLLRWMPSTAQVYNILSDNLVDPKNSKAANAIDMFGQVFGFGAMESPITKAFKFTSPEHKGSGLGQMVGGIIDAGAYYNAFNSYLDAIGEEQEGKVKSHDTWVAKELIGESDFFESIGVSEALSDSDFFNGIISGFLGYNLSQDLNEMHDFSPQK